MLTPFLRLTFREPRFGYWDGGKKAGGDFTADCHGTKHPGEGRNIQWGCHDLNFWFSCNSGRSWKEAAAIAKRRLQHLWDIPATVTIVTAAQQGGLYA